MPTVLVDSKQNKCRCNQKSLAVVILCQTQRRIKKGVGKLSHLILLQQLWLKITTQPGTDNVRNVWQRRCQELQ